MNISYISKYIYWIKKATNLKYFNKNSILSSLFKKEENLKFLEIQ